MALAVKSAPPCNCRRKTECPLDGQCQTPNIVYEATATSGDSEGRQYVGACETPFKLRFNNHKLSFRNTKYKTSTELSKHVWKVREGGSEPDVTWRIIEKAPSYSNTSKRCCLCVAEKFHILSSPKGSLLNSRNELISKCRHLNKFLLSSWQGVT